jgi:hypothetical protein
VNRFVRASVGRRRRHVRGDCVSLRLPAVPPVLGINGKAKAMEVGFAQDSRQSSLLCRALPLGGGAVEETGNAGGRKEGKGLREEEATEGGRVA